LSGHTHDYERLEKQYGNQKTHFVITGGGGGGIEPLGSVSDYPQMDTLLKTHHYCRFEIDYNHCRMEVYNQEGTVIDKQDFSKPLRGIDK
ncbi:MAG: hypothetical protein KDC24_15345, partial [Saprospiraceae bacterium]|nr:hypothetical protein [Saprospiraceae bacterium]